VNSKSVYSKKRKGEGNTKGEKLDIRDVHHSEKEAEDKG